MNYDLIMAPRIVDKEQKRLALIQAAVFIFAAKGFQSATMSEIAARAGVGTPTGALRRLYHSAAERSASGHAPGYHRGPDRAGAGSGL